MRLPIFPTTPALYPGATPAIPQSRSAAMQNTEDGS
jgi:hypothetical protein